MGKREKILVRLLERSGPKLHTLLLRLTLNEHTTEDLMQELFCRLCNVKDLSKIKNLEAYARQVALHLGYDWLRDRRRKMISLTESGMEPLSQTVPIDPEAREQLRQILDTAAGQLTGLMWDCFVMRYIEQESYEEIAERLGKKPQYMRSLCAKAMAKLREMLIREKL